jgi:hypothetical protein
MNRVLALGPRARRLRRYGAILSASVLVALLLAPAAQAVHDLDFELDGNIAKDSGGGADAAPFDWASFFSSAGAESPALPDASRPGFTDSGFSKDFSRKTNGSFSTVDSTTFATGSKDTLPITPGWQCNKDNNVNDKIDILNAYAVAYVDPATDDQILYFALERFSNDGDANVAFWFLQSNVSCVSPGGGSTPFTGHHVDGDLLVVSSFTKGGVVSTIDVYEWNGDDTGSLNQTAIAHGVDCKQTTGPDDTCATVNDPNNGVHRRHPLVAVADGDALRLRPRLAGRVRRLADEHAVGDVDVARLERPDHRYRRRQRHDRRRRRGTEANRHGQLLPVRPWRRQLHDGRLADPVGSSGRRHPRRL